MIVSCLSKDTLQYAIIHIHLVHTSDTDMKKLHLIQITQPYI